MNTFLVRLVGFLVLLAGASPAFAEDGAVLVTVDRAKVFKIDDGAAAVIIGNPFIADVAMFDQNTVVITGKSYGTTNLVILDADNKPIVDEVVTVRAADTDVVSVFRKTERASLSCQPNCEPMLRLGDTDEAFAAAIGQANQRNEAATQAAGGGS